MANRAIHSLTDVWNTGSGTFTAIGMDVTDNASATGSKLLDLEVGGASKMVVLKDGRIRSAGHIYGQASKTTSGTIDIVTQGVYVPTGLVFTLDSSVNNGVTLGTSDKGALKNTSGKTVTVQAMASYDGHAGNNQVIGIKMAKNGTPIAASECRAFAASASAIAKLFCFWFVELANNDELSMYAANHSGTDDITFQRGRIQIQSIIQAP
jgi:hypothetical protein